MGKDSKHWTQSPRMQFRYITQSSFGRDFAQVLSDLWDDEHDGVDDGY